MNHQYLMCSRNLLKIRNVCNGPNWKPSVYKSIMDKHICHTEHCDPKALHELPRRCHEKSISNHVHGNHLKHSAEEVSKGLQRPRQT